MADVDIKTLLKHPEMTCIRCGRPRLFELRLEIASAMPRWMLYLGGPALGWPFLFSNHPGWFGWLLILCLIVFAGAINKALRSITMPLPVCVKHSKRSGLFFVNALWTVSGMVVVLLVIVGGFYIIEGVGEDGNLREYGHKVFDESLSARIKLFMVFSMGGYALMAIAKVHERCSLRYTKNSMGGYILHGVSREFVRRL